MITLLAFEFGTYCTEGDLESVAKALANNEPVRCWWHDAMTGQRYEETFIFTAVPQFLRTETDAQTPAPASDRGEGRHGTSPRGNLAAGGDR